jgi:peptidoglycan/xylan/chitin deacetylase (PgdA/CDA1 family)
MVTFVMDVPVEEGPPPGKFVMLMLSPVPLRSLRMRPEQLRVYARGRENQTKRPIFHCNKQCTMLAFTGVGPHTELRMLSPLATGIYAGLGALGAVGLAAGGAAYAAMWPASQIFGEALIAPRRAGELALTFDDGPNPAWTPRLLDILATHNVGATFFLVGRFAEAEPGLVRRIAAAGHLVGNHSWSHPNLALTAASRIHEEIHNTSDTLAQITGDPVRFFRPPFGARRPYVLDAARVMGMIPVMWNAMANDWSDPLAERIAARLKQRVDQLERRGWATNIVLHDGGHLGLGAERGPSVAAAGQLIVSLKAAHHFVTLDAWAPAVRPA